MHKVIARLKELHEKASPPNWFVQEGWTLNDERFCHIDGWTDEATHGEWLALKRADADLIAEVRNAIPALLRYVEELEAKVHPPQGVVVPVEVARNGLRHLGVVRREAITYRDKLYEHIPSGLPQDSPIHQLYEEAKRSVAEINALITALKEGMKTDG